MLLAQHEAGALSLQDIMLMRSFRCRFIVKHQSRGLAITFLLGGGMRVFRINGELKSTARQISWFKNC
jgi:hypothetical protein